ncbi:ubiquitin thioesterase OTU1 isoform X2 [Hyalella azteca]|uniref:Ubiquitin thioesterase OTU n=1 Tax=Hyalella azteca TaxID=294128 RepID=A0A8B7P7Z9_HYAAZ|nr:ubiquitin thioesterase OTU1 isoform X1 [Hyalella azteca]XP_047736478.1 ubiquitin thioesterase OTU1 isoform X2 [Hyalella azteca]
MTSTYRLRVRCAGPNSVPLIDFLQPESTFENLHQILSSATEIPEHQIKILCGYPPKPLKGYEFSQLKEVGIKNGDVLIVEKRTSTDPKLYSEGPPQTSVVSESKPDATELPIALEPIDNAAQNCINTPSSPTRIGTTEINGPMAINKVCEESAEVLDAANLVQQTAQPSKKVSSIPKLDRQEETTHSKAPKRSASGKIKTGRASETSVMLPPGSAHGVLQKLEVPSDNSCLFASMVYVLHGSICSSRVQDLRREVAEAVRMRHDLIPDEVLDKPRAQYCAWIIRDQSWGGEIELAVLSDLYAVEIVTVDARTARINRFGESSKYPLRVFLLYDGIHYDPLHMESPVVNGMYYTSFSSNDDAILAQALELASQAHASGSFTNTDNFTLQCGQCGLKLRGETEAVQHAKSTAHTAFEEVKAC